MPNGYEEENTRRGFSDMMRKAVFAGLGALFMTEDSIKRYVSEARLPRDIASYVLDNAQKGKEELLQYIAREIANVIRETDVTEQAEEFLAKHKIRIAADIEFLPREESESDDEPDTKVTTRIVKSTLDEPDA